MPAKVLIKEYEPTIVLLRKTDANFATNTHTMTFKGTVVNVKGFLGVVSPNSNVLSGALTFMYGGHRQEVVFDVSRGTRNTIINTYVVGTLSGDEDRLAVKTFMNTTRDKLLARMVQRDLHPGAGSGRGSHPRLEGRRRTSGIGPQVEFTQAVTNGAFSQGFVVQANTLFIHYR